MENTMNVFYLLLVDIVFVIKILGEVGLVLKGIMVIE